MSEEHVEHSEKIVASVRTNASPHVHSSLVLVLLSAALRLFRSLATWSLMNDRILMHTSVETKNIEMKINEKQLFGGFLGRFAYQENTSGF